MAGTASVPNPNFTAGTDAVAAEVNANFQSLVDFINNNMVHRDGQEPMTGTQSAQNLTVTGTLTGNLTGNATGSSGSCTGNAATATKWASEVTLTVDGDMTGSVVFDGATAAETLTLTADLEAADIPDLSANKITSDTLDVARVPDLNASKIDAGTFGTGNYTFPGALTVNGLLDVSSQKKIEFGNENDQIRFDDTDDEFSFWIDGVKQFQIGGAVTGNDIVTKATGTFKSFDSGSQFPTGSSTAAHIITAYGVSALVKNSSVAADKENVSTDLGSYLTADMIDSVVPKMWNRITAPGYPEIGPIADDMETISEFLASHGTDVNGDQILMGVDQTAWMSLMTLAIQDLRDRMEAVEAA